MWLGYSLRDIINFKKQIRGGNKLNTIYEENNHITLMGKVTSEKRFSHEIYGEKFYVFDISVPRLSGSSDIIPVTISERLLIGDDIKVDSKVINRRTI